MRHAWLLFLLILLTSVVAPPTLHTLGGHGEDVEAATPSLYEELERAWLAARNLTGVYSYEESEKGYWREHRHGIRSIEEAWELLPRMGVPDKVVRFARQVYRSGRLGFGANSVKEVGEVQWLVYRSLQGNAFIIEIDVLAEVDDVKYRRMSSPVMRWVIDLDSMVLRHRIYSFPWHRELYKNLKVPFTFTAFQTLEFYETPDFLAFKYKFQSAEEMWDFLFRLQLLARRWSTISYREAGERAVRIAYDMAMGTLPASHHVIPAGTLPTPGGHITAWFEVRMDPHANIIIIAKHHDNPLPKYERILDLNNATIEYRTYIYR
ncbi:MAG: hypothetical protein AOA65_0694 [Candidatus Bathyarchaeota archaeon BA1]|nr:MAG: hypothetical protein AOA65_0694 [Candidatus Bathyarchaeota archaeon BA1]